MFEDRGGVGLQHRFQIELSDRFPFSATVMNVQKSLFLTLVARHDSLAFIFDNMPFVMHPVSQSLASVVWSTHPLT